MIHYSFQPRDQIFRKGNGLSITKNMSKNISENTTKNVSYKYSHKIFSITLNNLLQMHLKLLQKTAEATGDLIGNKIADTVAQSYDGKIKKVSRTLQQNNSEAVTNVHDKEIRNKRHQSPKKDRNLLTI